MDWIAMLMDPTKEMERIPIPSGQVNGALEVDSSDIEDDEFENRVTDNKNIEYAKEYQDREDALYAEAYKNEEDEGNPNTLEDVSTLAQTEAFNFQQEELRNILDSIVLDDTPSQEMPIDSYREKILSLINVNEVIVIQGPTGCGKTTHVPQFILDDCKANGRGCKIVVTQPRRIAAITVARRVCEERAWELGKVCGYQVGLERQVDQTTLLLYVTTGVLLQKLISAKNLHEYTHVIIDEVHERTQDLDLLLIIIRKFLFTNSRSVKVILMSATFQSEQFAYYFKSSTPTALLPAPIVMVNNETKYNIQIFYANHIKKLGTVPAYSYDEPRIATSLYDIFTKLVRVFDSLDQADPDKGEPVIGSVLVFLPGLLEIEEAYSRLKNTEYDPIGKMTGPSAMEDACPKIKWDILPLHSSITIEEQRKVFLPAPEGKRKIILSTNIAESSITVSDITYVVDFCLTKTMVLNKDTQYQSLQLKWASHVNCTQRAGRVGRVSDGRVYRLVDENFFHKSMQAEPTPEIKRAPLDRIVLATKKLDLHEPPKAILALALDPPDLSNIDSTIWYLKEIGALLTTCRGVKLISDGDLTFLGDVMAMLPIDVQLTKFIVLGHMFSCLDDCIIMAAGSSLNNIFSLPFQERLKAYTNKMMWADGSSSDMITYLNLYKVWERNKRTNAFGHNFKTGEKAWVQRNYLSLRSLKEWEVLINEIKFRLARYNIKESVGPGRVVYGDTEKPLILKVVMCGAFYPNYFKRSANSGQVDEREAVRTLGGLDPFNTVYFSNFDHEQPGLLYAKRIKQLLVDCSPNMEVSFDSSSKVYVQFLSHNNVQPVTVDGQELLTTMPGKIKTGVYHAVRRRQLKINNPIPVLDKAQSWEYIKRIGLEAECRNSRFVSSSGISNPNRPVLPSLRQSIIKLNVSEIIDAGHFWAHLATPETFADVFYLEKVLNQQPLEPVKPEYVEVGKLYAALFSEDKRWYRCKVLSLLPVGKSRTLMAQIMFIDYGNTASVPVETLKNLPLGVPVLKRPLAIECVLCKIQPSIILNPRALWSDAANKALQNKTRGRCLYGKIYSIVFGVVHLELYLSYAAAAGTAEPGNESLSLNEWLRLQGYAQTAEESFLSKENNRCRAEMTDSEEAKKQEQDMRELNHDIEPPHIKDCPVIINLKGPFSPLEMNIFSMTVSGQNKHVNIEPNSVNTVLLDTDPQDPHDRLVVAVHVGQSPSTVNLSLRHTTIMPNVNGFLMLMTVTFCPTMEPKPTRDGSSIAAVLCGLGAHEGTNKSQYPQHDITLPLDMELTESVLQQINEIRYLMNMSLHIMSEESKDTGYCPYSMEKCQNDIKVSLLRLLKMNLQRKDREFIKSANVWGKYLCDAQTLHPQPGKDYEQEIWPLHWTFLANEETKEIVDMQKHLTEMGDIARKIVPMNEMTCRLCDEVMYTVTDVRLHLIKDSHREKVKDLAIY